MAEQKSGRITHDWGKIGVAALSITDGELSVGDTVHIKGHTSDFTQPVESMEIDHKTVEVARPVDYIALTVTHHAREHDVVYTVTPD